MATHDPIVDDDPAERSHAEPLYPIRSGISEARDGHPAGMSFNPPPHAGVADQEQTPRDGVIAPGARADRQLFARYGVARRGRMSEVARRLGIGRSTLYRKIKDYGIASSEPVAS
jgi:DNA-binding NtrC family response regulator